MAKKKINELNQTHGKTESFEPTTLDQIWGDTGLNKYNTFDEGVYLARLHEMNKTDLQTHASQVGIIPIDNIEMLTKRLVKEFQKHISAYRKPAKTEEAPQKISKEVKKILEEGR